MTAAARGTGLHVVLPRADSLLGSTAVVSFDDALRALMQDPTLNHASPQTWSDLHQAAALSKKRACECPDGHLSADEHAALHLYLSPAYWALMAEKMGPPHTAQQLPRHDERFRKLLVQGRYLERMIRLSSYYEFIAIDGLYYLKMTKDCSHF